MSEQDSKQMGRRQFIRIAGLSVAGASLTGLGACSGGDSTSSAPAPKPESAAPKPAPKAEAPKPMPKPAPEPAMEAPKPAAPAGQMARVSEDDPVAKSLGYKHDAADVDLSAHPKRGTPEAANQYCKNCILYQGKDGDEWGGCSIFGGKLVNANGWCASYAPKAG